MRLRAGGQLILIDFHRIQGKSSDFVMGHVRAGQEVFVREITTAGFKVVGEEKFLKENYFVRFQKKEQSNANLDDLRPKKLIEWGWDEPDTKFMRANIRQMEQLPFDGLVFHINGSKGSYFTWELWGSRRFTLDEFKQAIDDLQATEFRRFTHRFLRVNVTPGKADWFDDQAWAIVLDNFAVAARIARQGRSKGFMFDVEQYEGKLFDYRQQKQSKTFADYQRQVRRRGREWMQAVNKDFPDITILLPFGYSAAYRRGRAKDRSQVSYGLLADFLDGMLDTCSKETTLVDAWEPSYPYKEQKQFEQAYQTIKEKALDWTAVPGKYRSQVKAGFGIRLDNDWRRKGWNLTDFSKNHFSPGEFESAVRSALGVSDQYVWIYTEQPRWWTRENLPQAYVDALTRAKSEKGPPQENAATKRAREIQEFVAACPDEPLAKNWSLEKAADHLDKAATTWLTHWKCAACHTSYLYVMAGPSLHTTPSPAVIRMRQYLEYRVTHWDSGQAADKPGQGSAIKPLPTEGVTEIVATASTLAFLDSKTTGKLNPVTRQALDRIWNLQQPNGAWTWNHTNLAPLEYDDYFGAAFAALGVGAAPDGYSQTSEAQKGLAKLRTYFQNNRPPNLHHKAWLLWASSKMDHLMTPADRQQTVEELLKLQQVDGGWGLPSLWKPSPMRTENKQVVSDGYATGLAIYVLRQAGLPTSDPKMEKGITWLKTHERESGAGLRLPSMALEET